MIDSIVEFYNVNLTLANAFYDNQSISVPPPLSCAKGLITAQIQGLNTTFGNITNNLSNTSVPSSCEPFYSNFKAFKNVWFQYVDQLRFNTISMSVANPVLTPFFVADLICELDIMIIFAANATSFLSGIDSETIFAIFNGEAVNPLPSPLDCVVNDLTFMSNQITLLLDNIIPGFENFAINSTSKHFFDCLKRLFAIL